MIRSDGRKAEAPILLEGTKNKNQIRVAPYLLTQKKLPGNTTAPTRPARGGGAAIGKMTQ